MNNVFLSFYFILFCNFKKKNLHFMNPFFHVKYFQQIIFLWTKILFWWNIILFSIKPNDISCMNMNVCNSALSEFKMAKKIRFLDVFDQYALSYDLVSIVSSQALYAFVIFIHFDANYSKNINSNRCSHPSAIRIH